MTSTPSPAPAPAPGPGPSREKIRRQADAIEAELKAVGYWQAAPLKPEQYKFTRAYAGDTMAFPQWLQFIFLPRVRDLLAKPDQTFPSGSSIGAYAVREMNGDDRAAKLLALLSEFDRLIAPADDDDEFFVSTTGQPTRKRRMSTAAAALAWTVVMIVLGAAFAFALPMLIPVAREEILTFSASQPPSQAYDLLAFTLHRQGPTGRADRQILTVELFHGKRVAGGELFIDPMTLQYHYADADGQPRTGKLAPDAVMAWMARNGAVAPDADAGTHLPEEAAEVVRLAEASRSQPALDALLPHLGNAPVTRAASVFDLSIPKVVVDEQPVPVTRWLRWGVPCGLWLLGVVAILLRGWRREA